MRSKRKSPKAFWVGERVDVCGERRGGGNGGSGCVKVDSGRRGLWYVGEGDGRSIGLPAGPGARRARTAMGKGMGDSMEIHCRKATGGVRDKPEISVQVGIKIQIEVAWAAESEDWVIKIDRIERQREVEARRPDGLGYLTARIENIAIAWVVGG